MQIAEINAPPHQTASESIRVWVKLRVGRGAVYVIHVIIEPVIRINRALCWVRCSGMHS